MELFKAIDDIGGDIEMIGKARQDLWKTKNCEARIVRE
jgi:hypothetical protein